MKRQEETRPRTARWPFGLALGTSLSAVPLLLFGGSVTTIGAGMAVDGWLVAEGHFLLFFPIADWFRDTATFVEHTHRLFGVLVGLFAIATLVAVWRTDRRRSARLLALFSLVGVCAQGALGGFRVLENDPALAFVHGVFAQVVFAVLCATALVLSPSWARAGAAPAPRTPLRTGRRLALLSILVLLFQVTTGAEYRHALRPAPAEGVGDLFVQHVVGAVLTVVAVGLLVLWLNATVRREPGVPALAAVSRRLGLLLGLQVLLGFLAWTGYRPGSIGPLEWGLSIVHVLGAALLLMQGVQAWMWLARLSTVRSPELLAGRLKEA